MARKNSLADGIEGRIKFILLFFFIALAVLVGRLFSMQIVNHKEYSDLAAKQHNLTKELSSRRGDIFVQDKDGNQIPVALNKVYENLIISPKDIKNPSQVIDVLTKEFNLDETGLQNKMAKKNDSYEVILKKVEQDEADKINSLKLAGVYFEDETSRVYPHQNLAAQLLGFAANDQNEEVGRYGLERFYNQELAGKNGFFQGAKDASGFWVALGKRIINPPRNGSSLFLTIDYNVQSKAEEILQRTEKKWKAESGAILVMEPKTGKILALAANPSFDPNQFNKEKDLSVFMDPLVESMFELGSVMKPFTAAGALERGFITPDTTYDDTGEVKFGSYVIKNFDGKAYHTQTMTQVLEKSLNTGAVFMSKLEGHDTQYEFLKKFGFGEDTGIDLPNESPGNISNLKSGRDLDFATASFGQGIAVTPLQVAAAFSAVANDGKLMKPYVVDKIADDSGNIFTTQPEEKREVISSQTAQTLTKMLVSVVNNGFEDRAGVKGYFIAGKTGTAQIPNPDRAGYSDQVIHTFVGYAPAFNPRFLALIQLNKPRGNKFAANTLTPAFHDLAEYILNYYEVPPDQQ